MKNLLIFGLLVCISIACQTKPLTAPSSAPQPTAMESRSPFIHTVFFYLKDDVTAEQKNAFEKGMEKLGTCPTIANYRIGKPAMTPREIVDNSYGYSWIVEFASTEDQDAYQTDPIHLEFIEKYQDLWASVKVYDSMMMN